MLANMEKRKVLFLDIDNCLYSKNTNIAPLMSDLINKYVQAHLNLPQRESYDLQRRYYKEYGLSIQGLVKHHKVDPLDFNEKVDNAVPLEDVLKPDLKLRKLLQDVDTSKVKLWLLTNAYITHGQRVVRLLGVDDLFEGITYCDYAAEDIVAKPNHEMYKKAMEDAEVESVHDCYFVDDTLLNAKSAADFGWTAVHLVEPSEEPPKHPASQYMIRSLEELRGIFPDFFLGSKSNRLINDAKDDRPIPIEGI